MPRTEEADRDWDEILAWHERQHLWARDVRIEPVDWLWDGFIPRGMVTLLTGEEGLGKSQLANRIAAAFTQGVFGDQHPDGSGRGGLVKYYTAEDPAKQVLVPRLIANEADLGNVALEGIDVTTFLPSSIPDVARGIDDIGFRLVVFDPVIAYVDAARSSNSAQDVREIMRKLAAVAERTGATILGIMHPKKGEETSTLHKMIGGSSAFGQAARSVLGVARHPEKEDWRVVGRIKGNLGRTPVPYAYEINGVTARQWDQASGRDREVPTSKVELRGPMPDEYDHITNILGRTPKEGADARRTAIEFLLDYAFEKEALAGDVLAAARDADISERTLRRAMPHVGVRTHQHRGVHWWSSATDTKEFAEGCTGLWRD